MPLIAIVSPKGGVGKSTVSAHLAAMLVARGHRVLAVDLDPQNALRLHFGLSIQEEGGFIAELAQGRSTPWEKMAEDTPSGCRLLAHGVVDAALLLGLTQKVLAKPALLAEPMRQMLADPRLVVLVDSPPGPTAALSAIFPLVNLLVVVLLADAGSAAMIPQVVSGRFLGRGTLAAKAAARVGVVMNQVDLGSTLSAAVLDAAESMLGPRLLGAVCYDERLGEALASKRLLLSGGGAAEDLQQLAQAIVTRLDLPTPGEDEPAPAFPALSDWGLR